ncbi:MAG: 50S ribosomal protein L7/L12 [Candidatus Pacebacteria bacterium]|nr:50S ribosomal protein L7/L12 [Candidatus Paceibacterota bacterium]
MADEKEKIEVPAKFKKLVEEIEQMSVIDLAELVKILEEKFGVSAAPAMAVATAPVAAGEATEEKTSFNVMLTGIGEKKIDVIKAVRDITQLGLKEAKDMVDAAEKAPQAVKEGVKKEEAEEMKKKFEAAGAKVELK